MIIFATDINDPVINQSIVLNHIKTNPIPFSSTEASATVEIPRSL